MYLRWHEKGKLKLDELVKRRYQLEDINKACYDLQAGPITGRAIIDYTCLLYTSDAADE